jgi:hypothetical protein
MNNPAATLTSLLPDLRAAHAAELGVNNTPAQRFDRIRGDLEAAWKADADTEGLAVAELEARWAYIVDRAFARAKEFPSLRDRLDLSNEPAALPTTLLRPLGRGLDECTHTRMLGALLDRTQNRDLATRLLKAMLDALDAKHAFGEAELASATVEIEPGWDYKRTTVQPDLVISLSSGGVRRLVVIENKIRATDHENQLDSYALLARERDKDALLIYLTPHGAEPELAKQTADDWQKLSYWKLAIAWRRELATSRESGTWTDMLRLYLASILQDVLNVHLPDAPSRGAEARLVDYLHAALGESA